MFHALLYSRTVLLGLLCAAGSVHAATEKCKYTLSDHDRLMALYQIQNLMGRYSHNGGDLATMFALNTETVSFKTPGGPVGIEAMTARAKTNAERGQQPARPGRLNVHSMFTQVLEVAEDGKTAKGVWDSFGPNIESADSVGTWLWSKYAVDFVKETGQWKIWHLQVYPVFMTPYDKSITQSAKENRDAAAARGEPPPGAGVKDPRPGAQNVPANLWIYDGVTPQTGPNVPEPYCSFDPKNSY